MECLKNSLLYAPNLAKIAASRLMFTIGFKSGVSHAKRSTAVLARKNTTLSANCAKTRLELEAIKPNIAKIALTPQVVNLVAVYLKRKAINIETIALTDAAMLIKPNFTLAAIIWQRYKEMGISVENAVKPNRLMYITLTCLGALKRLNVKGAITT